MKKNLFLIGLIIALNPIASFSQEVVCDDFTEIAEWPTENWSDGHITLGATLGYAQEGNQAITFGTEDGFLIVNSGFDGLYGANVELDFEYDGGEQTVNFELYGIYSQFDQMGIRVNGSDLIFLDDTYPMTIDGITVELDVDTTDVAGWRHAELTFEGNITSISHFLFESGILEECVVGGFSEETGNCDDLSNLMDWPMSEFGSNEEIGFIQDGTVSITSGDDSFGYINGGFNPGIHGVGSILFDFDGSNQSIRYNIYGWIEQYSQMGYSVNGSTVYYMDETFPLTIDGIVIDLDSSATDFGIWDYAYLTFTGNIEAIEIIEFESGVAEVCVDAVEDAAIEGCDDFTNTTLWPAFTYSDGGIVGYSQDSTQSITLAIDAIASVNSGNEGIYLLGDADFSMDGSNQVAQFEIYGFYEQYDEMGFAVNGSTVHYMSETFPMAVDGITIDLDTTATDTLFWEYSYLTFSGVLDEITIVGFESGVTSLCISEGEEGDVGIENISASKTEIYPNPTSRLVTITSESPLASITVFSLTGQIVYTTENITNNSTTINLSDLKTGIYLVKTKEENGAEHVQKLIKK